jgi:rare lipoprotein A
VREMRTAALDRLGWRRVVALVAVTALALVSTDCARRTGSTRQPGVLETYVGLASFYGPGFHGKLTASGVRFDMRRLVAAHPTYPFGTVVRVTNLTNGRSIVVRILDRGPARRAQADGVIIDLAQRAAERLGFVREGRTRVRLDVLRWGG